MAGFERQLGYTVGWPLRAAICIVVIAHSILVFDVKATDLEVHRKKTCYMKPEKKIKRLLFAILNSEDSDTDKIKVCLLTYAFPVFLLFFVDRSLNNMYV